MSHAELVLRPDSATVHDGELDVAIRLPHYRSLPMSCIMALSVRVDGVDVDAEHAPVSIDGGSYRVAEMGSLTETEWFLQDPAVLHTGLATEQGRTVDVEVAITIRIPYVIIEPFGPLERVIESHRELVVAEGEER